MLFLLMYRCTFMSHLLFCILYTSWKGWENLFRISKGDCGISLEIMRNASYTYYIIAVTYLSLFIFSKVALMFLKRYLCAFSQCSGLRMETVTKTSQYFSVSALGKHRRVPDSCWAFCFIILLFL